VVLLIDHNVLCRWPECVSTKGVGPRCFILETVLSPTAVCTGVVGTNRVVAVGVAVPTHVRWFLILGASAVTIATACVGIDILTVVALVRHLGNGCHQLLDLCFHKCNFVGGLCVCSELIVGTITCNLLDLFL
jgi:hypothetical protein